MEFSKNQGEHSMKTFVIFCLGSLLFATLNVGCSSVPPSSRSTTADTLAPSATLTPLSTAMVSPSSTATAEPALAAPSVPSNTLIPTRLPVYVPAPGTISLKINDFEVCTDFITVEPQNATDVSLAPQCMPPPDRDGFVLQADYKIPHLWAALVLDLKNARIEQFDTISFFAKGQNDGSIQLVPKIELRRPADHSRVGIAYIRDMTNAWKQFTVPLKDLQRFGNDPFLCGWTEMSELVFTLESTRAGKVGTIFLDDIYLERRSSGAPPTPVDCVSQTPTSTEVPSATPSQIPSSIESPSATLTGSPSAAVGVTPTTPAPQPLPPPPSSLPVTNFDNGTGTSNLGGLMGVACPEQGCAGHNTLVISNPEEGGRGKVARLQYSIQNWVAYFIKLHTPNAPRFADLTPYSTLSFDIRGEPQSKIPLQLKLELHRPIQTERDNLKCREFGITNIGEITSEWQTKSIPISEFKETNFPCFPGLSAKDDIDELVFTFEFAAEKSGTDGVIYLDNIVFK